MPAINQYYPEISGPVDFLTLIGQPEGVIITKANVRTLIDVVFPHYIEEFDDWWDDLESGGYLVSLENLATFNAEFEKIDEEDCMYEGEQIYEWLLASFGNYIFIQ